MKSIYKLFLLLTISLVSFQVSASHFMGGNITYECTGTNTYAFEVTLYRDCNGVGMPGFLDMDLSSASCGLNTSFRLELVSSSASSPNPESVTPICPSESDVCLTGSGMFGIEKYVYAYVPGGPNGSSPPVTLPQSCTDWVVSTPALNARNAAISTGPSGNLYIEVLINNTISACNNSPTFDFDPVFYACVGDTVTYGHGVSDVENDSLVFSLTDCLNGSGNPVTYNPPYSAMNPLGATAINIDSETGVLTFVPTMALVSVICIKVEEYRNGVKIGEVMRDLQVGIQNCSNSSPTLSGINGTNSNNIDICANQPATFTLTAYDNNPTQTISILNGNGLQGATYTTSTNGNLTQLTVNWTPTNADIGRNLLSFSLEDDACPVLGISNYSYLINVVSNSVGNVNLSDTTIALGSSISLDLSTINPSCNVIWQPNPTLSCTNCQNPTATPTTETTYYYQINCGVGNCSSVTDSVTIDVVVYNNLQGVISESNGAGLNNALVYIFDTNGNIVDSDLTNSLGNYQFTTTLDSLYLLASPNNNNQLATFYDGAISIATATVVTFTNNQATINFSTLENPNQLSGNITNSDGSGLSNSWVYLLDNNENAIDSVQTDATGNYQFITLEDSVYLKVVPNVNSELTTYYNNSETFINAALITFPNTQATVNFSTLPKPNELQGIITNSNGLLSGLASLTLFDVNGNVIANTTADASGNYQFTTIEDSVYLLAASFPLLTTDLPTYYNGSETLANATLITFTNFQATISFSTLPTLNELEGIVFRSDGFALDNSWIYLLDNNENVIDSVLTDASGNYEFFTYTDSVYLLAIPNMNDQLPTYYNGAATFANANRITFFTNQVTAHFLTLPKPTTIEGIITRSDGLPLDNSWIHLMDNNLVNIDSVQTNIQGNYTFTIANTTIDYYLKATPSSLNNDQVVTYYNNVETIQAADSIPINTIINTVNFSTIDTASATGGKGINGVLYLGVENNPIPVADIRLILKNANGDFINDATTNDVGEFNFYGLDNSAYSIWVDKAGINNSIAPIALASDLSTDTLYFELFENRLEALINSTNLIINKNDISIYPNPVATELIIEYDLEKAANVNISIIDVQGKQVKSLKNEHQNSGKHQLIEKVNKNLLPNGIYFIRLQFDNQIVTKQILIQKN